MDKINADQINLLFVTIGSDLVTLNMMLGFLQEDIWELFCLKQQSQGLNH